MGATSQDFKNFSRDLKAAIDGSDAQMFVDNFVKKKAHWSTYFFDYDVDKDGCLCRAMWVDPVSLKNYLAYGDIVSFDTTYKTNKYDICPISFLYMYIIFYVASLQ